MKKPSLAAIILSGRKMPKNMSESRDIHENESSQDDYTEVAREILSAINSKDADALAESLKNFCRICDMDEDSSEDSEDSEGEE